MKYYLIVFLLFITSVHISQKINKDFIHKNIFRKNENSIDNLILDKINKININHKIQDCSLNCLECENSICKKCERGFYALKNICYAKCPKGFYADNYSLSCRLPEENPVFIKAYTFSRCTNKCGQKYSDCSCDKECKANGTCCSDYKYCDFVFDNISNNNSNQIINNSNLTNKSCNIENCFSCINNENSEKKQEASKLCLMCDEGFYYYKNKCLKTCPENTTLIESNNICLEKSNCNVNNCDHCDITGTKCEKCSRGYFLNENTCNKNCPAGMRADRIKFNCVNKFSFAFNMIFPSKGSCYNKCGYQDKVIDCSCNIDCLKNGNCCDDFEKECQSELKKEKCISCSDCQEGKCFRCLEHSYLHNGDCICKTGFYYDNNSDKCLLSSIKINSTQKRKNKYKSFSKKIIKNEDDKKEIIVSNENELKNQNSEGFISKLLKGIFKNLDSDNKENILNPTKSNIELKGNITLNIFEGNENPNIINEKVINENSFNNSTTIEKNINSHNSYVGNKYKGGKLKNKNIKFDKTYGKKNNENNIYAKINNKVTKKFLNESIEKDNDKEEIDVDEIIDFRKNLISKLNKRKTLNVHLKNKKKTFRKNKININKHNHIDHEKKFPEDFSHEEDDELDKHLEKTNSKQNDKHINEVKKNSQETTNKNHTEDKNKINDNNNGKIKINNVNTSSHEHVNPIKENINQNEKTNKNKKDSQDEQNKFDLIKKHLMEQNHENNDLENIIKNFDQNINHINVDKNVEKNKHKQEKFNSHNSHENSIKDEKKKKEIISNINKETEKNHYNNNNYTSEQDEEIKNINNVHEHQESDNYNEYLKGKEVVEKNKNKIKDDNMKYGIMNENNFNLIINGKKEKIKNKFVNNKQLIDIENYLKDIGQIDNAEEIKTTNNKQNQEKLNLNFLLPNTETNLKDNSASEKSIHNKITVFNHYFINDKSTNMHHPKNPNVYNLYGEESKNLDFTKFKHPKFVNDNAYKEFNNTRYNENLKDETCENEYEEHHNVKEKVYLIDKTDSKSFSIPESQEKEIKNSFLKNKFFKNKNSLDIENNYERDTRLNKEYLKKIKRININKYKNLDNLYDPEKKFKKINFKVFKSRDYNK